MNDSLSHTVARRVNATLEDFLGHAERDFSQMAPEAAHMIRVIRDFLAGGKLLRPQCVALGSLAAVGDTHSIRWDDVAALGAAVELVQAAALIHDDVLDHSPTRRGRPAVHVAEQSRHEAHALAGSARDFGVASAVIIGDLALTLSEKLAAEHLTVGSREQWNLLRTEVMAGQFLDITHQAGGLTSTASNHDGAMLVTRLKTVPYTILRPLLIGATSHAATPAMLETLTRFAYPTGEAFQIRDDLLGVFGDPAVTGKPAGDDLREGKRTVLVAHTLTHAEPSGVAALEKVLGNADATDAQIAKARDAMIAAGTEEYAGGLIASRLERALEALESGDLTPAATEQLARLAHFATGTAYAAPKPSA